MAVTILLLVFFTLPWPLRFDTYFEGNIFGIPFGYFLVTLGLPMAMLLVTFLHAKLSSDIAPYLHDNEDDL